MNDINKQSVPTNIVRDRQYMRAPLAERMRPKTLDGFMGQLDIIGKGKSLRDAIEADCLMSVIFWGPPGCGKTTLARIIAETSKAEFVPFSAVSSGKKDLKKAIEDAEIRVRLENKKTILFLDEIHRWNKAQQDALLPHIEKGTIVLIGATTENPSFTIINALVSRSQVYVLEPLSAEDIKKILVRALKDKENGLNNFGVQIDNDALLYIAGYSQGDARIALNTLEFAIYNTKTKRINLEKIKEIIQKKFLRFDKTGDEHYNIISALHKSMRDSDPDGALYWLARMLEAGEDPLYVARRLVRFASEDVGNADPHALLVAVAVHQSAHFIGMPECNLALAQAVTHLACAPKSNALYAGYRKLQKDIKETGTLPVPIHLRNAPTKLMKDLNYGADYQYAHDFNGAEVDQEHLPKELKGRRYYEPTNRGLEGNIREKLNKRRLR